MKKHMMAVATGMVALTMAVGLGTTAGASTPTLQQWKETVGPTLITTSLDLSSLTKDANAGNQNAGVADAKRIEADSASLAKFGLPPSAAVQPVWKQFLNALHLTGYDVATGVKENNSKLVKKGASELNNVTTYANELSNKYGV